LAISLQTPTMIRVLQRKLYREAKEERTPRTGRLRSLICSVCLATKPVGEPDAGNPHVRFDERGWETERCRMAQATAPILDSTRFTIGDDNIERVTTQMLLDVPDVPQRCRRAGLYRSRSRVMTELGWTPVRVRGLTRGGYLEQVRGYCRVPQREARTQRLPQEPADAFYCGF
jgi:hypothetical protein